MSRVGFRSKNPTGLSTKPLTSTGMTGQSSGRGMWVMPKVCHTTQVLAVEGPFAAVALSMGIRR